MNSEKPLIISLSGLTTPLLALLKLRGLASNIVENKNKDSLNPLTYSMCIIVDLINCLEHVEYISRAIPFKRLRKKNKIIYIYEEITFE